MNTYILDYKNWKLNESKSNWTSLKDLPSTVQDAISSIVEHTKEIVLKERTTPRKRIFNLQVYVDDRESSATFLFNLLKKENKNPKVITISTSGFTRHIEIQEEEYTIRLILRPLRSGMGMTTLNAAITELVPVLLYNSKKSVSNDPDEILEIALSELQNRSRGVLPADKKKAEHYFDLFESSPLFNVKMENAYAIYKWLVEYNRNSNTPIDTVYWAQRAKLPGVPSNTPADIIIQHKNGPNNEPVLLGVSLKAGTKNTTEPVLNTYIMNCITDIAPDMERDIQISMWNKIYSDIVDLYNAETGEDIKLTDSTYWEYNNRGLDRTPIRTVLRWYQDNHEREFIRKYEEARLILRDYIISAINESSSNRNGITFNKWLGEKMLLDSTFPIITLKAIGDRVEEIQEKGDNKLAKILQTEKLVAEPARAASRIIIKISTGEQMEFTIRTSQPGYNKMLGQFYNLRFTYLGIK